MLDFSVENRKIKLGHYSSLGLEFIANKNFSVEPYSSIESPVRPLLTDSERRFRKKVEGLPERVRKKVSVQLQFDGMRDGETTEEFYRREIAPTRRILRAPRRRLGIAASIAIGLTSLLGTAGYVHSDSNSILQRRINELSPWAFNGDTQTCYKALDDAVEKANTDIEDKYLIGNYFRKFNHGNS